MNAWNAESCAAFANAIGGYFELELPSQGCVNSHALRFQSARAAFASLLLQTGVQRVWLPYFLCNTIAVELDRVGISVERYELETDLSPSFHFVIEQDDVVLIVNYFGVCAAQVEHALQILPRTQCVVDNSQAFGEAPADCLGTIYSCRKFFGVPDGGLPFTNAPVLEPAENDEYSISRCEHLLLRLDRGPEAGLAAYRRAEKGLISAAHRRMSELTQQLMSRVDTEAAYAQPRENYRASHRVFGDINHSQIGDDTPTSPLTCSLTLADQADPFRAALIENRVFSPMYWPELKKGGGDKRPILQ